MCVELSLFCLSNFLRRSQMRFIDRTIIRDGGFVEADHPRDENGRFSSSGSVKLLKLNGKDVSVDSNGVVISGVAERFVGRLYSDVVQVLKHEHNEKFKRLEQEWRSSANKVTIESSFDDISNSITCKANAKHAIEVATKKCFGFHKARLNDGSEIQVNVCGGCEPAA